MPAGDAVRHAGDRSLPGFPPAVRRAAARAARTDRGHSGGRLLPRRRHHPAAGRQPDPLPARDRQGGGGAAPDRPTWRLGAGGNARRGGDVRAAVAAVALPTPVGRDRPPGRAGLPDPCRAGRTATAPARLRGPAGPSGRRPATTRGRCWPGAGAPGPVLGARRRADRPAAGHLRPKRDGGRSGPAHAGPAGLLAGGPGSAVRAGDGIGSPRPGARGRPGRRHAGGGGDDHPAAHHAGRGDPGRGAAGYGRPRHPPSTAGQGGAAGRHGDRHRPAATRVAPPAVRAPPAGPGG